jgi:hypothetical protein
MEKETGRSATIERNMYRVCEYNGGDGCLYYSNEIRVCLVCDDLEEDDEDKFDYVRIPIDDKDNAVSNIEYGLGYAFDFDEDVSWLIFSDGDE